MVPGCGFGHDVALISDSTQGRIEGLDIAQEAIDGAATRYPLQNTEWLRGDLFEWSQRRRGKYDLVWEHTCFSAISPERRADYAAVMHELIPSGGHLLGIFFPNPDHPKDHGPPFHTSAEELHQLFDSGFSLDWFGEPSMTYDSREGVGRELSMLWRRK